MKFIRKSKGSIFFILFFLFFFQKDLSFLSFRFLQASENFHSMKEEEDFIVIKANFVEKKDKEKNIFYLKEKIEISFKKHFIFCEEATINFDTYEIEAKKNVLFQSGEDKISADRLFFNYSKVLGSLYNVKLQSGKILIEGEKMEKISDKDYILKNAQFTFCTNCPPLLSFSSREVHLRMGDYISSNHPIARIYNQPFFYFPFISYPIHKEKKRSGFLFPHLDIINLGFVFSQGLLLSLSETQNLTLTGKYYSERGLKLHTQYQYRKNPNEYALFKGALIRDQIFNPYREENLALKKHENPRGFMQYKQRLFLPFRWLQRTNLNLMTDLYYGKDYPDEVKFHGDSALESQVSFAKSLSTQHINFEMGWYTNLLKANPLEKNNDAVHRFPEVNYFLLSQPIGQTRFFYNFHFNYVHFFRSQSPYDNVSGKAENKFIREKKDGFFHFYRAEEDQKSINQESSSLFEGTYFSDQIRTGHRIIFEPKIFYSLSLFKKVNMTPSFSYKDRLYLFRIPKDELKYELYSEKDGAQSEKKTFDPSEPYSNFARQRNLDFVLSTQTKFHKVFNLLDTKYKHIFEPQVSFHDTLWFKASRHTFFGDFSALPFSQRFVPVSNTDFFSQRKGIQFDYEDRIYDHKFLKFFLTNKIIKKAIKNGSIQYKTLILIQTEQSYDLSENTGAISQPLSPMKNFFQVSFDSFHLQHIWNYFHYVGVHQWDSRIQVDWSKRQWIRFAYQRSFVIKEDNTYNYDERTENFISSLGLTSKYLDFEGNVTYSLVNQSFQRWSYSIVFKPPGQCVNFQFQNIKEIGIERPYFTFKLNLKI